MSPDWLARPKCLANLLCACPLVAASAWHLQLDARLPTHFPLVTRLSHTAHSPYRQSLLDTNVRHGESFIAARRAQRHKGLWGGVGQRKERSQATSSLRHLINSYGSLYAGTIGVGTAVGPANTTLPQAELRVIFDTGSSELWVSSSLCSSGPCTDGKHRRYNPHLSDTFEVTKPPKKASASYASGELRGIVGIDDVRVGPLLARRQELGLIAEESGDAFRMPFDGIVGLGFPSLGHATAPIFDKLTDQLQAPQFAFYLHPDHGFGGAILWGTEDPRLYHGPLTWFPVPTEEFWCLDVVELQVGSRAFQADNHLRGARVATSSQLTLAVDSGSTFYAFGREVFAELNSTVPDTVLCSEIESLPIVVFTVRDADNQLQEIIIPPAEYMVDDHAGDGTCFPGFVKAEDEQRPDETLIIFGELFLKNYFAAFRHADRAGVGARIGLARADHGAEAQAFLVEASAAAAVA